jgi:hypothetical protein
VRDQRESRVTAPNVGVRFNVLDVCPGKAKVDLLGALCHLPLCRDVKHEFDITAPNI